MSKFEEKKYKQTLIDDTPDLWDKIDSQLSDDMFTTDSKPDMNMKPGSNSSPSMKKKVKPVKIYKVAGILAACIALLIIPVALINSPSNKKGAALDTVDKFANNTLNKAPENESFNSNITDNAVTNNDNANNDPTNNNANAIIEDNSSDNTATNEDVSNNLSNAIVDNSSNEDNSTNVTPNADQNALNNKITDGQIILEITGTHQVDTLGLVYGGLVKASKDNNIKPNASICVSLKFLSKTELGKKHDIGSNIIITLKDSSFDSSLNNPYYASTIAY